MNGKQLSVWIGSLLTAVSSWALEGQVEVLTDRANLRGRPMENAEVSGQVNRGEVMELRDIAGDWVGVAAPTNISVWVNSDFLADGKVNTDRLNVRSGAGINYPSVGAIPRGTPVQIRGQMGQWTEIAPPNTAVLWIHKDLVRQLQPVSSPAVATNEPPSSETEIEMEIASDADTNAPVLRPAVAAPVVPVKNPPPPDLVKKGLVPLEGQGSTMEKEGTLQKSSILDFGRISNYCLIDWDHARPVTICYIRGNNAQLKTFEGRRLHIKGEGYWIKGNPKPVIVPRQITPLSPVAQPDR